MSRQKPPKPEPPPRDYRDVVPFPEQVTLEPIAVVRSQYVERHGTPRQATVDSRVFGAERRQARIELLDHIPDRALKSIEGFEMLWVVSYLHLNKNWNSWVFPPRGPRVRRGVLATRAPHRPNQLGLSAVRLVAVEGRTLVVEGVDLLDGTPVLDIKPYVPYADAFPDAKAGWVDELEEGG